MMRNVGVAATLTALLATGLGAQSAERIASVCSGGGGVPAGCDAGAAAASWMTAAGGLLASAATLSPDLHRTIGRRMPEGAPRVGVDIRLAFAPISHPALISGSDAIVDRTQLAVGVGGAIGFFDGLQLYPGLGGVLSIDGLVGYTFIRLPEAEGYESKADVQTFGVRLGLVRESFSAPGVALTVVRSLSDPLIFTGDSSVVNTDISTTSTRLAIGKDVLGLGLHASIGRDWVSSNVRIGVPAIGGGTAVVDGTLDQPRTVVQGGASLNFLVIRIQADAGWGLGGGRPAYPGLDPDAGSFFGSLAVRLIL